MQRLNNSQIDAAIAYVNQNHDSAKGTKAGYLIWYMLHFFPDRFTDLAKSKAATILHALDDAVTTGDDTTLHKLLQAMPHTFITAEGHFRPALSGLAQDDNKAQAIAQGVEAAGQLFKDLVSRIRSRRKNRKKDKTDSPFMDRAKAFFQAKGNDLTDKVRNYVNSLKPQVQIDVTSQIKKDWWIFLAGAAGITAIGVIGYKLVKS
ncbi:MAG: hypothetical protein KatS3mg031_0202 [Chitinophagales bacterium]|nr:MAG: hypothetical protein KatS3mg031_0202 [Chitinophagales bacterium]